MWAPNGNVKLGGSQKWVDLQARFLAGRQLQRAIRGGGDLGQAHRFPGTVADAASVDKGDVVRLQQHHAELLDLLFQFLQREVERRTADRRAAAAEGADAVLHDRGVAVQHDHVVDIDAQFVGRDLRERGLLALAMRRSAGQHRHFAGRIDLDRGAFPSAGRRGRRRTERADLAVSGEADAHQTSLLPRFGLFLAQLRIIHQLQRLLQRGFIVAAVVGQSGGGGERKLVGLRKVLQPNLRRVHLQFGRQHVHHALDAVRGFGPSRAAIGIGGDAVGEHADDVGEDVLNR